MARETRGRGIEGRGDVPPAALPQISPQFAQPGHDFTLQAVIEMHRSIGELSAKTDRLIADVKSQGEKIDSVRLRLAWVAGGAAVVGFLVAVGLAALRLWPLVPPAH
jgi:hypothetical protein